MPINDCNIASDAEIFHPDLVNLYGCTVGAGTTIGPFIEIQHNVVIGKNCAIQSHAFICTAVTIGDNVFVGHGVTFINDKLPLSHNPDWICLSTIVEDNVSIGSNATILPVKLGKGCIVGAGSVVTKDVPPGVTVAGNPARPL